MKKITCLFTLLLFVGVVFAQNREFSSKEIAIINTKSIETLQNYEILINKIGLATPIDIIDAKSSAESLIELFVNRKVLVYNDLDPFHTLSEFYEVETYASNLILWYPDGIEVSLIYENAKTTSIRQHDENIFSMDVLMDKNIKGNYLNKQNNNNKEQMIFRIAFSMQGKTAADFMIAGVRNATSETKVDDLKTLQEVNSEDLSEDELVKVNEGIRGMLNDYTNFFALLGDPQEVEEDKVFYEEKILDLFKNSEVKILNDIDPKPKATLISVPDYLELYKTNFPDGIKNISLNVDSAVFGHVSKDDQGGLFTYLYIDKFFSALINQKELFKSSVNLMVKVNFIKSGNSYTNFTIESIDKTGFSYFETASVGEEEPVLEITPVTRKGLSVYGSISYGLTTIEDENITSLSMQKDQHEWEMTPSFGIKVGGGINYYFTNNLGLSSGIDFQTFGTKYSLKGTFQDDDFMTDINGKSYNLNISADYDSTIQLSAISIPILFKYTYGKPGAWGVNVDAGLNLSYIVVANYKTEGNYKAQGYYPTGYFPGNTDPIYIDDPLFGPFYERTFIEEEGDLIYNKINMGAYGKVSVSIPIGYYSSIEFGPEMLLGLNDLSSNNSNYLDIFGHEMSRKPVSISYMGANVKFLFKL